MESHALPEIIPNRRITGMSAILLPLESGETVDWRGFDAHVERTLEAGLTPAVNMDTGYANLIPEETRTDVLQRTKAICSGRPFVAGTFVPDQPGSRLDLAAYQLGAETIVAHAGTPILFQSHGLTALDESDIVAAYQSLASLIGDFYAFELSTAFAPFGRIYSLELYKQLLGIPQCLGAKHSSLSREAEWQRIALRNRVRPDFKVLTGNDLAIDMVMYGSDYLLGLSTFDPVAFAQRDQLWETGDTAFFELNDWLQYLGMFAFRNPVPAYKHSAAQYLKLKGWIQSSLTYPGSPTRPDSDLEVLKQIAKAIDARIH